MECTLSTTPAVLNDINHINLKIKKYSGTFKENAVTSVEHGTVPKTDFKEDKYRYLICEAIFRKCK